MRKVAIFGNAGGGKSTLARRLAEVTRVPLYPLDTIQFKPGGGEVPHAEYLMAHREILNRDAWSGLCRRHLTPRYRRLVTEEAASKPVHHLRSPAGMRAFLEAVREEHPEPGR
jgi:GTPase SAR1 family protein